MTATLSPYDVQAYREAPAVRRQEGAALDGAPRPHGRLRCVVSEPIKRPAEGVNVGELSARGAKRRALTSSAPVCAAVRSVGSGWAIEGRSRAIVAAGLSRTMLRQLLVGGINVAVDADA